MARAVQTAIDLLNFFVESRNAGTVQLVVQSTATSNISADIQNTDQRGGMFFITLSSVSINQATLGFNFNAKDVQSGSYFPYARVSIDAVTLSTSLQYMALFYVGNTSTAGSGGAASSWFGASTSVGNMVNIGLPLPGTFQIVSSVTYGVATTASMTGALTYNIDYGKIM